MKRKRVVRRRVVRRRLVRRRVVRKHVAREPAVDKCAIEKRRYFTTNTGPLRLRLQAAIAEQKQQFHLSEICFCQPSPVDYGRVVQQCDGCLHFFHRGCCPGTCCPTCKRVQSIRTPIVHLERIRCKYTRVFYFKEEATKCNVKLYNNQIPSQIRLDCSFGKQ